MDEVWFRAAPVVEKAEDGKTPDLSFGVLRESHSAYEKFSIEFGGVFPFIRGLARADDLKLVVTFC